MRVNGVSFACDGYCYVITEGFERLLCCVVTLRVHAGKCGRDCVSDHH